jgi:hypothetical protein
MQSLVLVGKYLATPPRDDVTHRVLRNEHRCTATLFDRDSNPWWRPANGEVPPQYTMTLGSYAANIVATSNCCHANA